MVLKNIRHNRIKLLLICDGNPVNLCNFPMMKIVYELSIIHLKWMFIRVSKVPSNWKWTTHLNKRVENKKLRCLSFCSKRKRKQFSRFPSFFIPLTSRENVQKKKHSIKGLSWLFFGIGNVRKPSKMLNDRALYAHNKNKSISDRNDRATNQTHSQQNIRNTYNEKTLKPQPVDMPCDCVTQNTGKTCNANCEILFFLLFQINCLSLFISLYSVFIREVRVKDTQKTGSVEIRMPLK